MTGFAQWLAATPLGTALKAFIAIILTLALVDWQTRGAIDLANWQAWVLAGLASALPVITNYLNPADGRYGKGSDAQ